MTPPIEEVSPNEEKLAELKAEALSKLEVDVQPLAEKWVTLEYKTHGDRNMRGDDWFETMRDITDMENRTRDEMVEAADKIGTKLERHNTGTDSVVNKMLKNAGDGRLTPREIEEMGDVRASAH